MEEKKTFKSKFLDLIWKILQRILPDKPYLSLKYRVIFKKRLDWKNPKTISEKMQWLKVYGFRPEYVTMVDKIAAKDYVAGIIGDNHIIKTIGVWDKPEDIDFDSLPDKFVLKCNHGSGEVMIFKDKSSLDIRQTCGRLSKMLKDKYYLMGRETPYKYIKPRILAEEYIESPDPRGMKDYKFFCFDGEPKLLLIASNRQKGLCLDFFDMDYKHLPIEYGYPLADVPLEKPSCFEEMKRIAAELSKGCPHIRVDLYDNDGKVLFGELTLFSQSGFAPFKPLEWETRIGEWLHLPPKNTKR